MGLDLHIHTLTSSLLTESLTTCCNFEIRTLHFFYSGRSHGRQPYPHSCYQSNDIGTHRPWLRWFSSSNHPRSSWRGPGSHLCVCYRRPRPRGRWIVSIIQAIKVSEAPPQTPSNLTTRFNTNLPNFSFHNVNVPVRTLLSR
jgi:hypothetical protein